MATGWLILILEYVYALCFPFCSSGREELLDQLKIKVPLQYLRLFPVRGNGNKMTINRTHFNKVFSLL